MHRFSLLAVVTISAVLLGCSSFPEETDGTSSSEVVEEEVYDNLIDEAPSWITTTTGYISNPDGSQYQGEVPRTSWEGYSSDINGSNSICNIVIQKNAFTYEPSDTTDSSDTNPEVELERLIERYLSGTGENVGWYDTLDGNDYTLVFCVKGSDGGTVKETFLFIKESGSIEDRSSVSLRITISQSGSTEQWLYCFPSESIESNGTRNIRYALSSAEINPSDTAPSSVNSFMRLFTNFDTFRG